MIMKTTLQFNDDEIELATYAFNGAECYYALSAIDEYCRRRIKDVEMSDQEEKALDLIRGMTIINLN
jgi:hypothetical protein